MEYKHVYKFYKLLGICIISVLGSITSLGGTTKLRSDPNYKGKNFSCRKISLIEYIIGSITSCINTYTQYEQVLHSAYRSWNSSMVFTDNKEHGVT